MKLLAEGLAQEQIANRLVISPKTVSTHIQHVLAKLGVHSRAQAVAVVLQAQGPGPFPNAPPTGSRRETPRCTGAGLEHSRPEGTPSESPLGISARLDR